MKAFAAVLGLVAIALPVHADEGAVYRWVDKDGTPHYQDRPPENMDAAQELNLRYRLSDPAALASAASRKAEGDDVAQLREQQQAEDQAAAEQDRQDVLNENEAYCAKARERLQKYETAHKLYRPGPDGERKYLSDEEIDAARLEARQAVDQWCGQ